MSDGFFERWSRRKQQAREGERPAAEPPAPPPPAVCPDAAPQPPAAADAAPVAESAPPTLDDARALTAESDFRPFVAKNVDPEVKNLALKKLFADPHFNVMDRMDVYIDDYSRPTPLPEASLRRMASAAFLKLADGKGEETPTEASEPDVAQSLPSDSVPSPPAASREDDATASHNTDDHADLRLQPDDAPGPEGAGRGTG